ncbi:hypothetical protein [Dactylosporangium sp. NPDC005555]|uniref:hypothetical protein n=1 Tax=Dactylosporangium sp. NPDC005555 TaxID=3154889 RepID=UPI0033B46DDD
MPGNVPPVADERSGRLTFLDQQRPGGRPALRGATCRPLMAAAEGWPATPWVQPWEPATATAQPV